MRIIIVFVASWLSGIVAYGGALALFYGETISTGDLSAVLFWSLLTFGVLFFALYWPVLHRIRRRLRGVRPLWPFPLIAAMLAIAPAIPIVFFNGGSLRSFASEEAYLFYLMFGAAGAVAGVGFAFVYRHANDRPR